MRSERRRWPRLAGGTLTRIEDATYTIIRRHEPRLRPQRVKKEMEQLPITVKASITDGQKHVVLVIQDIAQIASLVAGITGHSEMAAGIAGLAGLATTAIEGYQDAAAIIITPETITSLLPDSTPLVPATDLTPPNRTSVSPLRLATEEHLKFLQARGYKVETVQDAQAFIDKFSAKDMASFAADFAAYKKSEPESETKPE